MLLFLIMRFRRPLISLVEPIAHGIRERIESGGGGEATVAIAGVSFSGKTNAASKLVATATTQRGIAGGQMTADQARKVLSDAIPNDEAAATVEGSTVLWVDDNPTNNTFVVDAFREFGIAVTLVLSTRQPMELLEVNSFDAIISDMGSQEANSYRERAGYELLSQLRATDAATPLFVYAGSNLREHQEEATRRGAQGSTNRPAELISLVTSASATRKHDERGVLASGFAEAQDPLEHCERELCPGVSGGAAEELTLHG